MRRPRRGIKRQWHGGEGAVMYPDVYYPDTYYDTDYGNYPDTYLDTSAYPDYQDYGDYGDAGTGIRHDPRMPSIVHKTVILEGENSYLMLGDPDAGSSLFEGLTKDDRGRLVGVLPVLLNEGWVVAKMLPADPNGRVTVLLQRGVTVGK